MKHQMTVAVVLLMTTSVVRLSDALTATTTTSILRFVAPDKPPTTPCRHNNERVLPPQQQRRWIRSKHLCSMRNSFLQMSTSNPSSSSSSSLESSEPESTNANNMDQDTNNQHLPRVKRKLSREFLEIAIPAFVQLTAEPLASLVDTAYLGRLSPEVLGGAGVAISAQYAVSKLYNDPLLRTSISLVASQDGKTRGNISTQTDASLQQSKQDLSIAVSSALLLAFCIGVVQMFLYGVFATGITQGMGVTSASPMWHSAVSYLRVRALGTPAATLWLVTNGVFRGLGDTKTPLIYALMFTALNAILDPLFIFVFHFGASGAAAGTALAQYAALIPLLMALNRRVPVDVLGQVKQLRKSLQAYLEAGVYVLFRTLGKVSAYAVCARQVVRTICGQLGACHSQILKLAAYHI